MCHHFVFGNYLDSEVKICPLGTCQFYLLTVVVAEAINLISAPLSWKLNTIYS